MHVSGIPCGSKAADAPVLVAATASSSSSTATSTTSSMATEKLPFTTTLWLSVVTLAKMLLALQSGRILTLRGTLVSLHLLRPARCRCQTLPWTEL
eukprot:6204027-Pleurochrysis_carterae.AAC.1